MENVLDSHISPQVTTLGADSNGVRVFVKGKQRLNRYQNGVRLAQVVAMYRIAEIENFQIRSRGVRVA